MTSDKNPAKKNIFLIGLNQFNLAKLQSIHNAEQYEFHGLLQYSDVVDAEEYDIHYLIDKATKRLESFDGSIDAIIGYMDFPVSTMVPILCKKFNVRSSSVESFLKCEHKYWSRVEQQASIPEHIPQFNIFNPFDENPLNSIELPFPFWIKPVKSFGSHLGFRINDEHQFQAAVEIIREEISRIAEPFNDLLEFVDVDMPPEVADVGGNYCLAESLIGGHQCTIEGCMYNGEFHSHGIVDSIRYPNKSVFFRYEYPSQLPPDVQNRMNEIATRFLKHIDYNNSAFNMEFFWDEEADKIWFLEINTRIAQHHSDLFQKVDGTSNHEAPVAIALDRPPHIPDQKGPFNVAAVFFNRKFEDAIIEKVPDEATIKKLESQYPGTYIQVDVEEGMRLSDIPEQDSYSYIYSLIYLGADNQQELLEKYHACLEDLDFRFKEI